MEKAESEQLTPRWRISGKGFFAIVLLVFALTGLFRTPGAWSHGGSIWFPDLLRLPLLVLLFVGVHWLYVRPGKMGKGQAIALWLLIGGAFLLSLNQVLYAQSFLVGFGFDGPFDYIKSPSKFLNAPWGNF